MQQSFGSRPVSAPAVLGVLFIALGATTLVARELGFDLFTSIGSWGWPFFVIVPGVVLLAAALVPAPPKGIGFATAGAIVTTVGALLLYQSRADHFESWAYAWALIPFAAGLATALYGLFARERKMVTTGTTMAAIAAGLFLVGAWFFEGIFAGENRLTDMNAWWPIGVIVLGGAIVLLAVVQREPPAARDQPVVQPAGPPADETHTA
jgi:hypothetical protein